MSKKLLIIGGTGLVGSTIIKYATKDYEIFSKGHRTPQGLVVYNNNIIFHKKYLYKNNYINFN